MSLFAYVVPILAIIGIAIMIIAGITKLVQWYIMERYIRKFRENMKGGKRNGRL